jgi:hypothetical protein
LFIANAAADRRAEVTVEALTAAEPYTIAGAEAVEVAAGATVRLELGQALRGEAVGLRIHSTQPITATLVATDTDLSAVSSQPALAGGITLPLVADSVLALANPTAEPASLHLAYFDKDGNLASEQDVQVPEGSQEITWATTEGSVYLTTASSQLRLALVVNKVGSAEGWAVAPLGAGGAAGLNLVVDQDPTLG